MKHVHVRRLDELADHVILKNREGHKALHGDKAGGGEEAAPALYQWKKSGIDDSKRTRVKGEGIWSKLYGTLCVRSAVCVWYLPRRRKGSPDKIRQEGAGKGKGGERGRISEEEGRCGCTRVYWRVCLVLWCMQHRCSEDGRRKGRGMMEGGRWRRK